MSEGGGLSHDEIEVDEIAVCFPSPILSWPSKCAYRGTSLIRKRTPIGPYHRPMPRVLGGSYGGGRFLVSDVLL